MSKVDPLTPLAGGFITSTTLNDKLQKIEEAFENTVSLDGSTPNEMEVDLSLGDHRLINVSDGVETSDAATVGQLLATAGVIENVGFLVPVIQTFAGTAAQQDFTLTYDPVVINNITVTVDGLVLTPYIDYTLTTNVLHFLTAPPIPWDGVNNIQVRYNPSQAATINVPAVGSVVDVSVSGASKLYNRINDTVSIKDYGAISGGSAATNNTAIANAVATGLSVYVPAGTFDYTAAIVLNHNQIIYGDGRNKSHLRQTTAAQNGITISAKNFAGVRDLHITNTAAVPTGVGIQVAAASQLTDLSNLQVDNFSIGIDVVSSSTTTLSRIYATANKSHGIQVRSSGSACVDTVITEILSTLNLGSGIVITGLVDGFYSQTVHSSANTLSGLVITNNADGQPAHQFWDQSIVDSNGVDGVNLGTCNTFGFSNFWFSNRGSGKNCLVGGTDIRLTGGKAYNCNGHGIEVTGSRANIAGVAVENAGINTADTYDGINVSGSNCSITGAVVWSGNSGAADKTRNGVRLEAGVTNCSITGGNLTGVFNANKFVDNSGSLTNLINNVIGATEGTWTPTDASGAGLVLAVAIGSWSLKGRIVTATARIVYPATVNGANAVIGGLPFTVRNSELGRQGFISYSNQVNATHIAATPNAVTADWWAPAGGAVTNAQMTGSNNYITLIYEKA